MLSHLLAEVQRGRACRITTASEIKVLVTDKGCSQKGLEYNKREN